jgi:hypothetical protein
MFFADRISRGAPGGSASVNIASAACDAEPVDGRVPLVCRWRAAGDGKLRMEWNFRSR